MKSDKADERRAARRTVMTTRSAKERQAAFDIIRETYDAPVLSTSAMMVKTILEYTDTILRDIGETKYGMSEEDADDLSTRIICVVSMCDSYLGDLTYTSLDFMSITPVDVLNTIPLLELYAAVCTTPVLCSMYDHVHVLFFWLFDTIDTMLISHYDPACPEHIARQYTELLEHAHDGATSPFCKLVLYRLGLPTKLLSHDRIFACMCGLFDTYGYIEGMIADEAQVDVVSALSRSVESCMTVLTFTIMTYYSDSIDLITNLYAAISESAHNATFLFHASTLCVWMADRIIAAAAAVDGDVASAIVEVGSRLCTVITHAAQDAMYGIDMASRMLCIISNHSRVGRIEIPEDSDLYRLVLTLLYCPDMKIDLRITHIASFMHCDAISSYYTRTFSDWAQTFLEAMYTPSSRIQRAMKHGAYALFLAMPADVQVNVCDAIEQNNQANRTMWGVCSIISDMSEMVRSGALDSVTVQHYRMFADTCSYDQYASDKTKSDDAVQFEYN